MQDDVATEAAIAAAIEAERGRGGPLLPILHRIQHRFGVAPEAALPMIAEALNIGRAEVHGAMSFCPGFRTQPARTPLVKICRAVACQAQGGEALAAAAEALSAQVTVEPVFCCGRCASGPAALAGERPIAAAAVEKLTELLAE